MNTSAIILMMIVWIPVITLTIYFFVRIVRTPKEQEPDTRPEDEDRL